MDARLESTVTEQGWTVRRTVTDAGHLLRLRLIPPMGREEATIRSIIRAARRA
jgi:hypothetical protein